MAILPLGNENGSEEGTLLYNIKNDLADNNAGLISAKDVRENMFNLAQSMLYIVASGDWDVVHKQFTSNVHLRTVTDEDGLNKSGGILIVESGIRFLNETDGGVTLQHHPYPGPEGIDHGDLLASSLDDDDHPIYINVNGVRKMDGNLGLQDNWINADGNDVASGHGLKFEHVSATEEIIHVGDDSYLKFDTDGSELQTGRSTAQAWLNFSSVSGVNGESDTVTVHSSYNISRIERLRNSNNDLEQGKFRIFFKPGLFNARTDYTAIGLSTGRDGFSEGSDFDRITVGIVDRDAESLTFFTQSEDGDYTDAYFNDLVVFGNPSGVSTTSESVTTAWQAEVVS